MVWRRILAALVAVMELAACTDEAPNESTATVAFDLEATYAGTAFWDAPFPSDLRLDGAGHPDVAGFPNPQNVSIVRELVGLTAARRGFPVMPTAWFRFTANAPARAVTDLVSPSDAVLVDIDPASPERGTVFPLVAQTLVDDGYTTPPKRAEHGAVVAVTARPGTVLRGATRYAIVLRSAFAPGVTAPSTFADLAAGETPAGAHGAAAAALYAPLWPLLAELGIDDAIVATVFTTGDEVDVLAARSEAIRTRTDATISDLHVDATATDYCVLAGTVRVPQYQTGEAPYGAAGSGVFVLDADGVPMVQGMLDIPLRITLPRGEMPDAGWPLWQYFHGSGGASFDIVDEGPTLVAGQPPVAGMGPGTVAARYGIATAATALPVNPERIPGASPQAYLDLTNLTAFPHTFQQGVFEQRLLLDALLALEIDPSSVCAGVTLPASAATHHFDPGTLTAGGHSMGGMYTNMVGAVEPRFGALTPFGAGGFWPMMILDTETVPDARTIFAGFLGVDAEHFAFTHPVLGMLGMGWEIAEPGASMAKLARRPREGTHARHVYQPIGLDDVYFPNAVFDAAALAYGNQQAGELVWSDTQRALATDHLDGMLAYPVRANRDASDPVPTTSVVVQYADDGIVDSHQIYRQLDSVKAQYGCFLASYVADGTPTVIAPDAACPFTRVHEP